MSMKSNRIRGHAGVGTGEHAQRLRALLDSRRAVVGVVGLGYIGLPVAGGMVEAGLTVIGFDIDEQLVERLNHGECDLEHLGAGFVRALRDTKRFEATADMTRLVAADVIVVCVPTPLGPGDAPDLRDVEQTVAAIARTLRPAQLVVLESTTYPGTTRDVVRPALDASGLECGREYFLAYAPEREDPGRGGARADIPRLVGALDDTSRDLAVALYACAVRTVVPVSSAEVAEAAKLLENIYRAVNIAMVNEMKMVLTAMDIDIHEVVDAASTKPFGFQGFQPGPGLGGHCIPIDPFYLAWAARRAGTQSRFIELAGEVNRSMPQYVVERLRAALVERGGRLEGAPVLVLGLAYKRDVNDVRGSPGVALLAALREAGAVVSFHDPHVPVEPVERGSGTGAGTADHAPLRSVVLDRRTLEACAAVVIATDHAGVDYPLVVEAAPLVIDTRGVTRGIPGGDVVVG